MSSRYRDARAARGGRRAADAARPRRFASRLAVAVLVAFGTVGLAGWAEASLGRHAGRRPAAAARPVAGRAPAGAGGVLRVCADPNNLPFSNAHGEGFENRIAELVARDLGERLQYDWWPQRRAWVRNTINANKCDLAIGVPAAYDRLLTTRAYYESAYVFVSRADRHLGLRTLDDPRLRTIRIGLHFIGDDYSNPPPAHALGARGIVRNIVGFSIYGNYSQPNPPARLIDAVANGQVDVAIAWGPLGGYFASHEPVPLTVSIVRPLVDRTGMQFAFPIAMGVRKGDTALRDRVQAVLDRRGAEIRRILASYGVPLVDAAGGAKTGRVS